MTTRRRTAYLAVAIAPMITGGALLAPVLSLPPLPPTVKSRSLAVPLSAAAAALVPTGEVAAPAVTPEEVEASGAPVDGPVPSVEPSVPPVDETAPTAADQPAPTTGPAPAPSAAAPVEATPDQAPVAEQGGALLSPRLETGEFDVVGVTWSSEDADLVEVVEVRTRTDGAWSAWEVLDTTVDDGPDAGTEEHDRAVASGVVGTEPVVAVGAEAVQVRMQTTDGSAPEGVQANTVDGGDSDLTSTGTPLASASAAVSAPPVVSRAAWGADESKRNCNPSYASSLQAATLHHTAGSNNYTASQSASVVRGIYAYHATALGWCDVGYNFLVDKYGVVYEGRYGGITRAVRGAHAGGFNDRTVGVSMMGNYDTAEVSTATREAVQRLIAWKMAIHGVDLTTKATLTSAGGGTSKYSGGTRVTLDRVFGHRDVGSTTCPGRYGYAILPAVRAYVATSAENTMFVAKLYRTVLGRSASTTDLDYYSARMAAGLSRNATIYETTRSTEFYYREIDEAYRTVLGRSTEQSGLVYWRDKTFNQGVSLEEFPMHLMLSQEFWVKGGSTTEGFVNLVYRTFLGRSADPAGLAYWSDRVRREGRTTVISGIFYSPETAMARVNGLYQTHLNRSADPAGLSGWGAKAIVYGEWYVRDQIIMSQEYLVQARAGR